MNGSEADIHFEFWRYLQAAIETNPDRGSITYSRAAPEYSDGVSGRADIVVFDDADNPVLVIEAKRPADEPSREIDPFSPVVIRQAFGYAGDLGAPYFCTYNRARLVVFDAYEEGVPLLERSTKSYEISNVEEFADTLLDEIARLHAGTTEWDTLDTVFIDRVNSLHEHISPRFQESLTDHLENNEDFRDAFTAWTAAQGIEYDDESDEDGERIRQEFAEQAAYLLINKIVFYKILEDAPTYRGDVDPLAVSRYRVREDLEEHFQHIVSDVNFRAIYEHDPIYSEIPLDPVSDKVREFILELDEQDLDRFDSDVIGRIYEGVIPPERRRQMGEYYTPPAITDLITRLTITASGDRVLDPACGSGGFLVSAYHRIRDLLPEPNGSHDRILNQLSGVEINRFPAHLTTINLAIQDLESYTNEVDIEIADFFRVVQYQRFERERASAEGGETETGLIEQTGDFDAVVANPPYIRNEAIDDKELVREHLESREIDAEYISARSDVYVYFITHATEFIAEDGDLGFITSDRWLDTQYGEDVQKFILDNYSIRAIIKFDRQVFDDALVDSSVLILRRETDEASRNENVAKFIRVKQEMEIEAIASIVEREEDPNQLYSTDDFRVVTRTQEVLHYEDKWNVFFFAPPVYFDIDAADGVVELDEIADVSYGLKTGANPFFIAHWEDFDELGLEPYVTPCLKATGQVDQVLVTEEAAREWGILDIHGLVEEALDIGDGDFGEDFEERVKRWFAENDHHALVEYIRAGEADKYHERSSLQGKDVWFDLGELERPPLLHTQFTWRTHRVMWNGVGAPATNQFHCIYPVDDVPDRVLCGLLNSRVVWLVKELKHRRTGGQGMTRIQTMVYESAAMPIPDPRGLSERDAEAVRDAFDALVTREDELDDPSPEDLEDERDALDRAVLRVLGLEDRLQELKDAVSGMVRSRERAAGSHTEVLVERLERTSETEAIDLPGVEVARESTQLTDF